jgi:hypothetical protein
MNDTELLTLNTINNTIVFRPNQDECPGYEYYNAMTTNRWQDDKEKAAPSPTPWSCKIYINILI